MADDARRQEDRDKHQEMQEREARIREESREESFTKASEREMRREMQEKGPAEAAKDDLKATKEQVKRWFEKDADSSDSGS